MTLPQWLHSISTQIEKRGRDRVKVLIGNQADKTQRIPHESCFND